MYTLRLYNNETFTDTNLIKNIYYISKYNNRLSISTKRNRNTIITLKKVNDSYLLKSKQFLFCHGFFFKKKKINYQNNYVIDKNNKLAIYIGNKVENYIEEINIEGNEEIIIGKDENANIVLEDVTVSNYHAKIFVINNSVCIMNKSKVNKTYVNGKLIEEIELKNNDMITIANYDFKYEDNTLKFINMPNKYAFNNISKVVTQFPYVRNNNILLNVKEEAETIVLDLPKHYENKTKLDFFSYFSLFVSVGLTIVTITSKDIIRRTLLFIIPIFIIFAIYVFAKYFKSKKEFKKIKMDINANYDNYLKMKEDYIISNNNSIKNYYNIKNPSNKEIIKKCKYLSNTIWTSRLNDNLNIKLGKTDILSNINIEINGNDNNDMYLKLKEIKENNTYIEDVDYSISLAKNKILSINGNDNDVNNFVNNLILNIIYNYDYNNANIIFLTDEIDNNMFKVLRHFSIITNNIKEVKKKIKDNDIFICTNNNLISSEDLLKFNNNYIILTNYNQDDARIIVKSGKGIYNNINFTYEESNITIINDTINSLAPLLIMNDTPLLLTLLITDELNISKQYLEVESKKKLKDYEDIVKEYFKVTSVDFYKEDLLNKNIKIEELDLNNGDIIIIK